MPDQKLSQLTPATSVAGSDQLYIVQGGQSKRATAAQLPISTATAVALAGKEPSGAAADAIAAHLAAADPHPTYLTQTEAGALYAPLASVHDPVTLGATVADVLGLTGQQLTADDPGAGADRLLFWDHSAGRLRHLTLGANLAINDTTLDATGGGGGGGYPLFTAPTGFSVTGSGTSSITLSYAAGYSLPTTASQASWDTAAGLAATAVQPAALSVYVQTSDSRLTDSREWSAATVTQAAAGAGTETTRRAWTVERVWQAAAAWWQSTSGATGRSLAGAATPAAGRTVLELGTAATRDTGTAAGNVPILDSSGLVPSALLPGFVDDVLEFANFAAFPATGETGKIYVSLATNQVYRWSGSAYIEISPSPGSTDSVPEGSVNLYFTTARGQSAASSWWSAYRSTIGDQLATAATQAAARSSIGAGTSSLALSSSAPAALGATAAAGTSADAARADHVHQRSSYADLGAIGDGLILVISNKGETATAGTNYAEVPVPVPSGNFTLTAVRFGCHIDNTGSSSSTFNAYKRTAGGTKTSVLTGNATLASAASLVDVSGTITGGTFSAGDRIGVDLVGVGTGAQGLFAQFLFTRSAT